MSSNGHEWRDAQPILEQVRPSRRAVQVAGSLINGLTLTPGSDPKKRGGRSDQLCGVAKLRHGRADQAFVLGEPDVVDGATANSSPRTATGHKQDDQIVKTKPPAGNCSRVLDQSLGST